VKKINILTALFFCSTFLFLAGCGEQRKETDQASIEKSESAEKISNESANKSEQDLKTITQEDVTTANLIASLSLEKLLEAVKSTGNNDKMNKMIANKEIIILREGLDVIIEEDYGNGILKIKPEGHDFSLYTLDDGVAKKDIIFKTNDEIWVSVDKKVMDMVQENLGNVEILKGLYDKKAIMRIREGLDVTIVQVNAGLAQVKPVGEEVNLWVLHSSLTEKE